MNDIVKSSVESRKNALFASYDIKDPGTLSKIDEYFKRVEEFAKDCTDVMDFETNHYLKNILNYSQWLCKQKQMLMEMLLLQW